MKVKLKVPPHIDWTAWYASYAGQIFDVKRGDYYFYIIDTANNREVLSRGWLQPTNLKVGVFPIAMDDVVVIEEDNESYKDLLK